MYKSTAIISHPFTPKKTTLVAKRWGTWRVNRDRRDVPEKSGTPKKLGDRTEDDENKFLASPKGEIIEPSA
jgi:hypothetical protein